MTDEQALTEARRRFGGTGHVEKERERGGSVWYRVGVRVKSRMDVRGSSQVSWEEAFRDSERKISAR